MRGEGVVQNDDLSGKERIGRQIGSGGGERGEGISIGVGITQGELGRGPTLLGVRRRIGVAVPPGPADRDLQRSDAGFEVGDECGGTGRHLNQMRW